jgi:ribonuclease HI
MNEDLTQTLLPLEHAHLTPGVRSSRAALASLLHETFTEVGASGRLYTRDDIIPLLLAEQSHPSRTISDFYARRLSDTVALTTYTLTRTDGGADGTQHHSRRSSLWLQENNTWRLTFHQGTNLPPSSPIS